jgi:phosphoglycerol transferase
MKGRPGDWTVAAEGLPDNQLLVAAAAAGFDGLWIDRAGYEDRGRALEREAQRLSGGSAPTVTSEDGRRVFIDLRPLQGRVDETVPKGLRAAVSTALVRPTVAEYGTGFYGPESNEEESWRWATDNAVMTVRNESGTPQRVVWSASLRSAVGSDVVVTVNGRVVARRSFTAAGQDLPLRLPLLVPPEGLTIRFTTRGANMGPAGGDPRALFLQLVDPTLTNGVFERAARAVEQSPLSA